MDEEQWAHVAAAAARVLARLAPAGEPVHIEYRGGSLDGQRRPVPTGVTLLAEVRHATGTAVPGDPWPEPTAVDVYWMDLDEAGAPVYRLIRTEGPAG
jgi:hypothetical protein